MPDLTLPSLRLDGLGRGVPEYGKLGNLGRQHFNASHVPDQSMPPCRSPPLEQARHKTSKAHAHGQAYRLSSHTVGPGLQMSSPVPFTASSYLVLPGPTTPTLNGPPDQTHQAHGVWRHWSSANFQS